MKEYSINKATSRVQVTEQKLESVPMVRSSEFVRWLLIQWHRYRAHRNRIWAEIDHNRGLPQNEKGQASGWLKGTK